MLDIELIEDTIKELEHSPTTFDTCDRLASLYICRMLHQNGNTRTVDVSNDYVSSPEHLQVSDIIPAYENYVDTKRRYQQFEVVDQLLIYAMDNLCQEIIEFVSELYHNTETPAERAIIVEMVNNMRKAL